MPASGRQWLRAACAAFTALAVLGLGGCATKARDAGGAAAAAPAAPATPAAPPLALPPADARLIEQAYAGARSYGGTLSCAGCADRSLTLTVFADGTFRLREIEGASLSAAAAAAGVAAAGAAGSGAAGSGPAPLRRPAFDAGRWSTAPDGADLLVLHGAATGSRLLRRAVPDGLTVLDHEGREIRGLSGTTLARLPKVDPLAGPMRLAGLYSRPGGQAAFDDCATGRRLALALGGSDPALDAAYLAMRRAPDETVLAVVDGYFVPRPAGQVREELRVTAFVRAMRAARCDDIFGSRP